MRKEKPGRGRTWEAFYIGGHSFPGPLKATAGPLPLLTFFVSCNATPIFRELAEEKGRTKYLSTPSRNFSHT